MTRRDRSAAGGLRRAGAALLAVLLLVAAPGRPARAAAVGLEEVVQTVLEQNLNVEKEQQRIRRAEAQLRQAEGKFDWQVFADASVARKEVPDDLNGFLTTDTTTETIFGTRFGVSKAFHNGIVVGPRVAIFSRAGSISSEVLSESVTGVGLSLLVPLLRGAGVANAAVDELAQRSVLKASELSTTFAKQKLLQVAVRAYWRCIAQKYALDIELALARQIDEINAAVGPLVERGALPPLAGQELAADQALRRLQINRDREQLFLARRELAVALGRESQGADDLPLAVGEFPRLVNLPAEAPELTALALAQRSDLKSLQHILDSEDVRLDEAKNELWPRVDLVLEQDTLSLRYAQSLNANVEHGRVGEHAAAVQVAQINLELLRRAIAADVQRVLGQMRLSSENYTLAVKTYWLLKGIADDKRRQVRLGTTKRSDQIAALDKLAQAHQQVIDASLRYAVGLTDLRLITGTIQVDGGRSPAEIAGDFLTMPGP